MKALSLVQPMAFSICQLTEIDAEIAKRLENRTWRQLRDGLAGLARIPMGTVAPGEQFAIHASAKKPNADWLDGLEALLGRVPNGAFVTSAIVGVAKVVDVVRCVPMGELVATPYANDADVLQLRARFGDARAEKQLATWWMGPYALVLDDVRPIEPIAGVKGALYFWNLLPEHERMVQAQLARAA